MEDVVILMDDEDVVGVPETVTVALPPSKALASTKVPFTPAVMGTTVEVVPL